MNEVKFDRYEFAFTEEDLRELRRLQESDPEYAKPKRPFKKIPYDDEREVPELRESAASAEDGSAVGDRSD